MSAIRKVWIILKLITWHIIFWSFPTPEEELYGRTGYCHMELGDYEKAIDHFQRSLKDSGEPRMQSFLHSAMGHCYSQLGRKEESQQYYDKVRPSGGVYSGVFGPYHRESHKLTEKDREKLIKDIMRGSGKGLG